MATLSVAGSGIGLFAVFASTFKLENLPAAGFANSFPVIEEAFNTKNYGLISKTASTLSFNAAGGVVTMLGTGFTGTSGTLKQIEFVSGADRWKVTGSALWSDAKGGIYSGVISSVETVSGGTGIRMVGALQWEDDGVDSGFVGSVTTLQVTVGAKMLEVKGNFDTDFDSGTVTSFSLFDGAGNAFTLTGSFSGAAFFGAFENAIDTGNTIGTMLNAGGFLTGAAIISNADIVLPDGLLSLTLSGTGNTNGTGNTENNTITGNTGSNTIDGAAGADTMAGGTGNDTYIVDDIADKITDTGGIDTVMSSVSFTLGTGIEKLILTGVADINGTGNTSVNTITGNDGANTLDGKAGADTMAGGLGNDSYVVDNTGDVVTEDPGAGDPDTVYSSVTYTLPDNVENLVLTGTGNINGTGNADVNILTGNSRVNTLDGGAGADTMMGGSGNDAYIVDDVNDVVIETSFFSREVDHVFSSVDFTLVGDKLERLTLTAGGHTGTGNMVNNLIAGSTGDDMLYGLAGSDILNGNDGNDTLDGGVDVDTMEGGNGDDTFIVDNAADKATDISGIDTVMSSVSFTLGTGIEKLILTGVADINGTGNTSVNNITGNDGANMLDGKAGADTMAGGLGNDSYVVDNTGDIVTEDAGAGNPDTVYSSVSYILPDNVENLVLTGTGNINGTGNADVNILTGNSRVNTLDGGAGADTMMGGSGNDTYIVDDVNDVVIETSFFSREVDHVFSSVDFTLVSDKLERLTLTDGGHTGTGNGVNNLIAGSTGDDMLYGLAGSDILNGNDGNDMLAGGDGVDILTGGIGLDTFAFGNADTGIDTVTDFSTVQGDKIDIGDLLSGYTHGVDVLADFIQITTDGVNSALFVDRDGAGGVHAMTQVATLNGVTGLDAALLINSGNLIVT